MKKSLLFGAAALMAFAANAQSLTKVWERSMADHTSGETRSIAALGKYAVVPNKTTGMVELWDETGKVKEYDVNTWAAGQELGDLTLGTAVSTDEAGNIIVNFGFSGVVSCRNFAAIQADGEMFYIPCEFPGDAIIPEGAGRMDYLGDKTAGDITSNAFIITCPNTVTQAVVYNIYKKEQDPSCSYVVKIGDEENTETWNTESSAIPLATLDADAEKAPKFIARSRGLGGFRVSDGKSSLEKKSYTGENIIGWGAATCTNFTAFVLNGKEYAVVNQPDEGARTHSWELFDLETAQSLARWTMPTGEAVNYQVGFASSVNEDGTANIFQFNPGIRLAMYKFDPTAGVEGAIADDVNAPVKYYNLQGVEIANPENGLFIKKQGAKATKVVL